MKLNLSRTMIATLMDLHRISKGQPDVFYPAIDVHHSTLAALLRRGLICVDKRPHDGRIVRHVSMTQAGIELLIKGIGINAIAETDEPKRKRFTVGVQLDMKHSDHRFAMGQVERLKAERRFTPTLIQLLTLNEELERGDVAKFKAAYPEAYESLRSEFERGMLYEQFASYMVELEELRQTVSANVTVQQSSGLNPIATGGLQPIASKSIATPTFEDDDIELIVRKDENAGKKSAQAFIDSLMKLQEKKEHA